MQPEKLIILLLLTCKKRINKRSRSWNLLGIFKKAESLKNRVFFIILFKSFRRFGRGAPIFPALGSLCKRTLFLSSAISEKYLSIEYRTASL